MPKERDDKSKCSVAECRNAHVSLHRVPTSGPQRALWLKFIFHGNVPASVGKILFVCAKHFRDECFNNLRQYQQGFAERLRLIEGSVPSLYGEVGHSQQLGGIPQKPKLIFSHKACQTQPPTSTVATQISLKTLSPHVRSKGIQVTPKSLDEASTSTAFLRKRPFQSSTPVQDYIEEELTRLKRPYLGYTSAGYDPLEGCSMVDEQGPYEPMDYPTLTEATGHIMDPATPAYRMPTYIVYEKCLLELFEMCPACQRSTKVQTRTIGTFLSVEQKCLHCDYGRQWNSQPLHGGTPAGNLQLSAAVYSNGGSFFKTEKIFRAMRLPIFKHDTYRMHTRLYIEPAIVNNWKTTQDEIMEKLKGQKAILGGDMRADSPGHSAKFGSYTLMDLKSKQILDVQLVESSEVGKSHRMELEGLKRSLGVLKAHNLPMDSIVADRHPQVQKYLREEAKVTHYYDVRHIEKGLTKKMSKIVKNKDNTQLRKWLRSIKDHMYWTAASSKTPQERVTKWSSVLNHVQDVHTKCLHPSRTKTDKSKRLKPDSPAFCRLKKLLTSKRVLKDVEKLSPHMQTSDIEAFHSLSLLFAPKSNHYTSQGMLCRLYLAALHFNENAQRLQAADSSGDSMFRMSWPKNKKGKGTAKPMKTPATLKYVDNIMELVFEDVFLDPARYIDGVHKIHIPPTISSQDPHPDKAVVVSSFVSRFNAEPF